MKNNQNFILYFLILLLVGYVVFLQQCTPETPGTFDNNAEILAHKTKIQTLLDSIENRENQIILLLKKDSLLTQQLTNSELQNLTDSEHTELFDSLTGSSTVSLYDSTNKCITTSAEQIRIANTAMVERVKWENIAVLRKEIIQVQEDTNAAQKELMEQHLEYEKALIIEIEEKDKIIQREKRKNVFTIIGAGVLVVLALIAT